jgi:hypothetical protein
VSLGYEVDRLKRLTQPLDFDATDSDVSFDLRWDDLLGEVIPGLAVSAPTVDIFRDSEWRAYHFVHNQDDDLYFRFQLSHRWDPSTSVKVHVHWVPCVNPAAPQVVVWEARYAWSHYGVAIGDLATSWTTAETPATVAVDAAFKMQITPLATIAPGSAAESSILMFRLRRLGSSSASDTYSTAKAYGVGAANVMLLSCDLHYQSEKIGTTAEYPTP